MHSVFEQTLYKFRMLNSTKSALTRFYSTKRNTKVSSTNHYDTLKITPHATHNEVKSAYYKLSLECHPDKNKSQYAKQEFQNISEAYKVLGNHESRAKYDRQMMLHQQPVSTTDQEFRSKYKSKVYTGSSKIYNFDAWTYAHYGKQLHMSRIRRDMYNRNKEMEDTFKAVNKESYHSIGLTIFLLCIVILTLISRETVDVPVKTRKQK